MRDQKGNPHSIRWDRSPDEHHQFDAAIDCKVREPCIGQRGQLQPEMPETRLPLRGDGVQFHERAAADLHVPGISVLPAPDGPVIHPKAAAPRRIVFIAQSSRF